jgi:hypothetical protein
MILPLDRVLTSAQLPDGACYEVWFTATEKSMYTLRYFEHGVLITERSYETEIAARKDFERLVEEKM